jgi:hypothetical protein
LFLIIATYTAAILFRLSDDCLSQDVTPALLPIHDVPTMNYYASEGSAGSGLMD